MRSRILIADDNPAVRTALRQLLSEADREFFEAEHGGDAVGKAREQHPHIAILDLAMPVMDGLTAARQISTELPETILILCTMHWSAQLEVEAHKSGIRAVVSKARGGELVPLVRELLSGKGSGEAAALDLPVLAQEAALPAAMLESAPETAALEVAPAVEEHPDGTTS